MSETLILRQSSMQHTDGKRAVREDVDDAIPMHDRRNAPDAIGFTELVGETKRLVRRRCKEAGYDLHVSKTVGIAVHPKHTIEESRAVQVLDGFKSPTGRGSYRARPIVEVIIRTPDGNTVALHETHWITDGGKRREGKRGRHSQRVVDRVRRNGKGNRLAFWMGDTNEDEGRKVEGEVQKPLTRGDLVSIFDALDRYPNTHGRKTIDVVGHFDRDNRVEPVKLRVGKRRHSDHRYVDATYVIHEHAPKPKPQHDKGPKPKHSKAPKHDQARDPDLTITQRVVRNARARGVKVLDHDAWGSRARGIYAYRREHKPAKHRVDTLVQHITVTLDHGPLTGDFKADVRTVERIGLERFGSGVSYNFVVDMQTGMVAVGQPLDAKGTHTINDKDVPGFSHDQNYWARAIAVLGMPNDRLSKKAERSIALLIAAMVDEGALTRGFDYCPHSMFAYKDCPCDATRDRLSAIRSTALAAA